MNQHDPYQFGTEALDPDEDQRGEFRLVGRARVELELEASDPGGLAEPRVITAASSDLSPGGVKVVTAEALTEGALLPARIGLAGSDQDCTLMVEVVWSLQRAPASWQSGLKILDTGDRHYLQWMEAVAGAMEKN